jgi:hypothetical protein
MRSLLSPRKRDTGDSGEAQRNSYLLVQVPQNPLLTLELDSYYEAGGRVRTPDTSLEVRLLI